jgi:hypothetical protein
VKEKARWLTARNEGLRPLVKDPLALLSAEWFAERFDAQVIVVVRHPAGFVNSVRRIGWDHDFSGFADQPDLLDSLLSPYADEIRQASRGYGDKIYRAALLWKVLNGIVDYYRDSHPDWRVVKNEDLATTPHRLFGELFGYLQIPSEAVQRSTINNFTQASAPDPGRHTVRRNSQEEAWKWRDDMKSETVTRIRRITAPVWNAFYSPEDWSW